MGLSLVVILAFLAQADFKPHRIYKLRQKVSLNSSWKFYLNTPTGNPYETTYNDAAWQTVNVPHSSMYVAPTESGDASTMPSGSWMRSTRRTVGTLWSGVASMLCTRQGLRCASFSPSNACGLVRVLKIWQLSFCLVQSDEQFVLCSIGC